jgi:hypothetical protein
LLADAVLAGGLTGRACVHHHQKIFERLVLLFTVPAGINLLR